MGTQPKVTRRNDATTIAFASSLQHLLAELERIDLLIAAEVARTRRLHAGDEQFRGLYISEAEVDALLKQPAGSPGGREPGRPFSSMDLPSMKSAA